jgi:O-antigen/teichoic acid export membrane protein
LSQIRALANQTAAYGLSTMVGRMLNYLLVPLYVRVFVPAEYGVVTDLYAMVAFLNIVYTYGMETAYFRKVQQGGEKVYHTAFWSLFISSVVFTCLLLLFAQPLAQGLRYANHPEYVRWFALILGLDALASMPFARLRQLQKAWQFAGIKLFNIGLNIGLNLFFLLLCPWLIENQQLAGLTQLVYDPHVGVGYIFLSNLLANGFTLLLLLPHFPKKFSGLDGATWKSMFAYSLPLVFAGMAGMVNETIDRVLLKYLLPLSTEAALHEVGVYGAVYKLAMLMSLFTQTFRTAAEPFFFQQASKDDAPQTYAKVMHVFVLAGGCIFLGVTLFMDVAKHFVSEAYFSGLPVVPVLLLANLFLGMYYNQSVWYKLADQTRWGMYLSFFGAAITLVGNWLLIPVMGYTGSAYTTLLCYFLMMAASYMLGQKYYPVPYNLPRLARYLVLAVLFFVLESFLHELLSQPWLWLLRFGLLFTYALQGLLTEKLFKSVTL